MELRWLGSTKRQVPVIGQGTWYNKDDDHVAAVAALSLGIDLGMTHIDTAEMYLDGIAEEWIAEAIKGRRDEVFLVSKVLRSNASRRGTVVGLRAVARACRDRQGAVLSVFPHPARSGKPSSAVNFRLSGSRKRGR